MKRQLLELSIVLVLFIILVLVVMLPIKPGGGGPRLGEVRHDE